MRRLLLIMGTLLVGCTGCLAQVSTMGSTAMGLPSTPGAIVTSPLNGPSPFSATPQPGSPDTTLAPVPLASDPATPGTVVTCSTPTGQIVPGTPAVPVTPMSAMGGTFGTMPSAATAPTIPAATANSSASTPDSGTTQYLGLSAQPATSFMTDIFGSTIPAPQPPVVPALPQPTISPMPVPAPSRAMSTVSTSVPGTTATTMSSLAQHVCMCREHDDESGDARHDATGQRHGRRGNAGRIARIAIGLLSRKSPLSDAL